ncbi:MAG: DUF559 domain-containing protein [Myxococcales bacterium]|nr:DUF559 domain-containing protein [Myxococcales bacterium]
MNRNRRSKSGCEAASRLANSHCTRRTPRPAPRSRPQATSLFLPQLAGAPRASRSCAPAVFPLLGLRPNGEDGRSSRHRRRRSPTASEAALWRALRARQLGVEVLRQVVLGDFIADFVVPAAWLVIEVDGDAHRGRGAPDARRDRKLAKLGYRVLRLEAGVVERALPQALERVREALNA